MKFAGAGYLIYLGIKQIKNAPHDVDLSGVTLTAGGSPFRQGIVTEVLNPKTALFFLSFIPQFVSRDSSHAFAGFILLGVISVVLNTLGNLVAIMLTAPLKKLFTRSRRAHIRQKRASGAAMIALGTYVAIPDSH